MKKTIIAITSIISVFIVTTIVVALLLINSDEILKNFNIISVNNVANNFTVKFEKVKAAVNYNVLVYCDDILVLKEETTDTKITFELSNPQNNQNYKIVVYAYDKNNESIVVNNPYSFIYNEPTFSSDNNLLLTDYQDYVLLIDGNLTQKKYYISINDGDYVIKKERLTTNEYTISKDLFSGLNQVLTINLYDNNEIIGSINLYNNLSPVGEVKIITPSDNDVVLLADLNLVYEGGENATSYILEIYQGDALLKESEITQKSVLISSEFFKVGKDYTLKVKALYENIDNYTKSSEVNITIEE
jgi:hypothetical protein